MKIKVLFVLVMLAIFSLLAAHADVSWTSYPQYQYPNIVTGDWTLLLGSFNAKTNRQLPMSVMMQITKTNAQSGMQPASANLDQWSQQGTNNFQPHTSALDLFNAHVPSDFQTHSANLDSWSALATSAKQNHSTGLDYWDGITVDGTSITLSGGHISSVSGGSGTLTGPGSITAGHVATWSTPTALIDSGHALSEYTPLSQIASGSQNGLLSSGDWTTFNSKQAALGFTPLTPPQNTNAILALTIPLDLLAPGSGINLFGIDANTNPIPVHLGTGLSFDGSTSNLNVTGGGGGFSSLARSNYFNINTNMVLIDCAKVQDFTLCFETNAFVRFTNISYLTNYHDEEMKFYTWEDTNGTWKIFNMDVAGGLLRTNSNNWRGTNANQMDQAVCRLGPLGTNLMISWNTNWLPTISFTNSLVGSSGGGGGSVFAANQVLHWIGDDIVQTDGTGVLLWPDHLGNGHGLIGGYNGFGTVANGAVIPVVSNSVPAFNNHNVVYFDGTKEMGTNFLMSLLGSSNTVFVVLKQDGSQAENTLITCSASTHFSIFATFDNSILYDFPNNSAGRVSQAQPTGWDNTVHVLECWHDLTASGLSEIIVDGVSLGTPSAATGTPSTAADDFLVGSVNFGNTANFKGWIGEILVYNIALGSSDRSSTRVALGTKYGVPVTP